MHELMKHHKNKRTMRNLFLKLLALLLTTGLLLSCGGSSGSTTPTPGRPAAAGDLVSWSWAITLDTTSLNAAIIAAGMIGFTAVSDVSCYKLTYKTPDASGALINASGLVCLPATRSGGRPVLSYQHGTIFQDSDAPSSFSTSSEGLLGAVFAAIGYIVVMPDYIGYGDSTALMHLFLHAATLATQRLMEQSLSAEFPITASEPGAGGRSDARRRGSAHERGNRRA